jgi:hypothetical protein
VGLLTRIMSAADSAEDKKLVAEQRFPVRVRHNLFLWLRKMVKSGEHDG